MPSYDYYCPANGRTVEVTHRMSDSLSSWVEVCQRANIEPGDTPANSPVERLISGGAVIGTSRPGDGPVPDVGAGPCCGIGGCGCH